VAAEAFALGTGARGLHRLLGQALDSVHHQWPDLANDGIRRVTVSGDCVRGKAEPLLETVGDAPLREDQALREAAASGVKLPRREASRPAAQARAETSSAFTDTSRLNPQEIWKRIEGMRKSLGWETADETVRRWWAEFERLNRKSPALVLRLSEELQQRKASITELYEAFRQSGSDNVQANLDYLDFLRLKS
jgi:hypothetical protein